MAINFPDTPTNGQTFAVGDRTWIYSSTTGAWTALGISTFLNAGGTIGGPVQFPAGSVTAPSITPTGDPDTGIYFSAADNVSISTGGVQRLNVDSAGVTAVTGTITVDRSDGGTSIDGPLSTRFRANVSQVGGINDMVVRARGTNAAPTTSALFDEIAKTSYYGWGTTNLAKAAEIRVYVREPTPSDTAMGTEISFATSPIGGVVPVERMIIGAGGLLSGTGTSLGAWTAYTPTITASGGFSIGNGTVTAHYSQIGKTVTVRIRVRWGTTTAWTSGFLVVSLPISARSVNGNPEVGLTGYVYDASTFFNWDLKILSNDASSVALAYRASATDVPNLGPAAPMTWTTSDMFGIFGTYEAA